MLKKGCFIVISLLTLTFCEARAAKIPVAVMDFEAVGVSAAEADSVRTLFVGELVKAGRFQVVERSQLEEVLKEQGLSLSGCTDAECAVAAGKLVGASYAAVASVSSLAGYYVINVRVVGVEEGTAVAAATEKARSEALSEAVKRLGESVAADIPVEGKVIGVAAGGDYVYVDVGREDGLKVGMKGAITRRGEAIMKGEKVIGYETIDVGVAEVAEVQSRGAELMVIDKYRAPLESDKVVINVEQYFQVLAEEEVRREEKARKAEEKRLKAESRLFTYGGSGLSIYKELVITIESKGGYRRGPIEIAAGMIYDHLPYAVIDEYFEGFYIEHKEGVVLIVSHLAYAPIFRSTFNPRAGLVVSFVALGGGNQGSVRLGPKFDLGLRWGRHKNYELSFGVEWFLLDTADYFDLKFRLPVGFQYYF